MNLITVPKHIRFSTAFIKIQTKIEESFTQTNTFLTDCTHMYISSLLAALVMRSVCRFQSSPNYLLFLFSIHSWNSYSQLWLEREWAEVVSVLIYSRGPLISINSQIAVGKIWFYGITLNRLFLNIEFHFNFRFQGEIPYSTFIQFNFEILLV